MESVNNRRRRMTTLDHGLPIRWHRLTCPYCGERFLFLEWWKHRMRCDAGLVAPGGRATRKLARTNGCKARMRETEAG